MDRRSAQARYNPVTRELTADATARGRDGIKLFADLRGGALFSVVPGDVFPGIVFSIAYAAYSHFHGLLLAYYISGRASCRLGSEALNA